LSPPRAAATHIVVLGAQPEYLSGLRGPMIRDFLAAGHRVTAIGAEDIPHVRADLERWGARYVVVPIRRAGINPIADFRAIFSLYRVLRALRPDIVFAYTLKPVVYGMPIAWLAGVRRRFAMIAGRGFAFHAGNERRRRLARFLASLTYRLGLRFANGVLFHNDDDWRFFREMRLIPAHSRARRIHGSGVDLDHYRPTPLPDGPIVFLMISRLIADKGVREYVEAARRLKQSYPDAVFRLVGPPDPSPNGIPDEEIRRWREDGVIDYRGPVTDVRPVIAACHVYVLPSYGEGLPRSVLEAMAAGRPIVTTDVPGCRDTVAPGETGYLVRVRDSEALAAAMESFLREPAKIEAMGAAGLRLVRELFDVRKVNRSIIEFMDLAPQDR
jgi:glycosyltransferase involved in cell wall biosynthesis